MPRSRQRQSIKILTYEEACNLIGTDNRITIRYDGLEKTGFWYEDHMLKMFSACKLTRIDGPVFQVEEWPKKGD